MAQGDININRLKLAAATLGTGTPSASNYLRGDGTWQAMASSSDISNIENTAAMLAWDVYNQDIPFDDIYIDDLTDQTGIDLTASTGGQYDSTGTYWKSGRPTDTDAVDPASLSDVSIQNLKISSTLYWQKTSENLGFFSTDSAGTSPVTVGAGNTEVNITIGVNVVYATGTAVVCLIVGDGSSAGNIALSVDIADATEITAIQAATISAAQIAIQQANMVEGLVWSGKLPFYGQLPDPRFRGTAVTHTDGYMYIFGGIATPTIYYNDVYKLNLTTGLWTEVTTTGTPPTTRHGHSAIIYDGYMYIFGGYDGTTRYADTLKLNLTTYEWTTVSTSGTPPTGRYQHSAVYYLDGSTPYMYIFGGMLLVTQQDTHRLNLSTNAWSNTLSYSGTRPSIRREHTAVVYGTKMWVFGGWDGTTKNYQLHSLDLSQSTVAWSNTITCTGTAPAGIYGHTAVVYGDYMYVSCGNAAAVSNATYKINLSTLVWSLITLKGSVPPAARYGNTIALSGAFFYVFSGFNTFHFNDTFKFDIVDESWEGPIVVPEGTPPPIRSKHTSVVYNGCLYIWGGALSSVPIDNIVYKLDLSTLIWSIIPCSGVAPSARYGHSAIVYGNYMYVYGGYHYC